MKCTLWFVHCFLLNVLLTVNSVPDKTFLHFMWKKHLLTNQTKLWKKYVDKLLESPKAGGQTIASLFSNLHRFLLKFIQQNSKETLSQAWNTSHINCSAYSVTECPLKPVGNLIFTVSKKHSAWCTSKFIHHKWTLNAAKSLCLNLTFTKFHIKHLSGCRSGNLSIYVFSFPTRYCGILPAFTHYSLHPNMTAHVIVLEYVPIMFAMTYSVFSKGIVYNTQLQTSLGVNPVVLYVLWMLNLAIYTYHLTVLKYQQVCLTNIPQFHIVLIDGPDFDAVPTVIHSVVTCVTTFQCLLQVETSRNQMVSSFLIHFAGRNALKEERHLNHSSFETIPTKKCTRWSAHFCILLFTLPKGFYLNISLLNMEFTGFSTDDCKFGGISLFDGQQYMLDICRNNTPQVPARNIVISQVMATLVSYWYPNVSNVNAKIATDLTRCKPTRFNICKFNFHCHRNGLISNCLEYLQNISNNSAIQFEHGTDRFSRKHSYLTFVSLFQVQCAAIQLSNDFIDTVFHDENHNVDYCWAYFFPKPIAVNKIGIQFTVKGFVEKTEGASITAPVILDGQADAWNTISVNWEVTKSNHSKNNCNDGLKTSCALCNHRSLLDSCLKFSISKFCKICTFDQQLYFFLDYVLVSPILQNQVLATVFFGNSMNMYIDIIIKNNRVQFQEDYIVLNNTRIDIGTSLFSHDTFSVKLTNLSHCDQKIPQTQGIRIRFIAEGITQDATSRFSPHFEGAWIGTFQLSCQQSHMYFAAPGTLKQLTLEA